MRENSEKVKSHLINFEGRLKDSVSFIKGGKKLVKSCDQNGGIFSQIQSTNNEEIWWSIKSMSHSNLWMHQKMYPSGSDVKLVKATSCYMKKGLSTEGYSVTVKTKDRFVQILITELIICPVYTKQVFTMKCYFCFPPSISTSFEICNTTHSTLYFSDTIFFQDIGL